MLGLVTVHRTLREPKAPRYASVWGLANQCLIELCLSMWSHTVHPLGIELTFSPPIGLAVGASTCHACDPPPWLLTL